jgi:hypothetical protein
MKNLKNESLGMHECPTAYVNLRQAIEKPLKARFMMDEKQFLIVRDN